MSPLRSIALAVLVVSTACAQDQDQPKPVAQPVKVAPRLTNRDEMLELRKYAAKISLPPGDSLIVTVWATIDENGMPTWPEVKDSVPNLMARQAAIELVRKMRFTPGMLDGKPTPTLLKIPVKLVRPSE